MRTLVQLGISPRLEGDGIVMAQTPEAGAPLENGVECRLLLGRLPDSGEEHRATEP
jgi:hypothetical protein